MATYRTLRYTEASPNSERIGMSAQWERIGTARNRNDTYAVWRDQDGAHNVTSSNDPPSPQAGGYRNLDALLALKGCSPLEALSAAPRP